MGVGDRFQQELKYQRGRLPGGRLDWSSKPEIYHGYPDAPQVPLPEPATVGGASLWDVIRSRRSLRRYRDSPLSLLELSQLLWASQGITDRRPNVELRAVPSAGALYPVETYLGDYRAETAAAALDQAIARTAGAVFIWTGVFPRSKWKYKQRAYRYVYLDAGHIAQNLALAAVGLGLGTCQIAALYDDEANALLGVDGEDESVVYMSTVGRPA